MSTMTRFAVSEAHGTRGSGQVRRRGSRGARVLPGPRPSGRVRERERESPRAGPGGRDGGGCLGAGRGASSAGVKRPAAEARRAAFQPSPPLGAPTGVGGPRVPCRAPRRRSRPTRGGVGASRGPRAGVQGLRPRVELLRGLLHVLRLVPPAALRASGRRRDARRGGSAEVAAVGRGAGSQAGARERACEAGAFGPVTSVHSRSEDGTGGDPKPVGALTRACPCVVSAGVWAGSPAALVGRVSSRTRGNFGSSQKSLSFVVRRTRKRVEVASRSRTGGVTSESTEAGGLSSPPERRLSRLTVRGS